MSPELLNYGNAIWHGVVGAELLKDELGIWDEDILNAVRHHTTGAAIMSKLEQVIYMADYIEPARDFDGVQTARKITADDLGAGVAYQTKHTLQYLIANNKPVYPKTIETYNAWVPKYERKINQMDSKQLLEMAVKAGDGRRAEDIVALKVDQISPMADYFVIMTGGSDRQVQAIANAIIEKAHEEKVNIGSVEGKNHAQWVLIDLGDVVVHVFREETRAFYNLEKLWSDAPMVNISKWVND